MSTVFIDLVTQSLQEKTISQKWTDKTLRFLNGFEYLNSQELIYEQMLKLTHIGVTSLEQSTQLVQNLTADNLDLIENKLSSLTSALTVLSQKFETLDNATHSFKTFFSFKKPEDILFETFKKEDPKIQAAIRNINVKKHVLYEAKQALDLNLTKILDVYVLLERDTALIDTVDAHITGHSNELIKNCYMEIKNQIVQLKTNLVLQQGILLQKHAAVSLLFNHIKNCEKNVDFVSQATYSAILNIVELQKIIQLQNGQNKTASDKLLEKIKVSLSYVSTNLKTISASPFVQHVQ